jgi:ABC-2 type transport system ATP-binding protein
MRVDEALRLSGLVDSGERLVLHYSGGMRRRLEVAMGTINQPALLLLDEPTLGLDVSSRRQLWESLRGLKETGVCVILTTHYLEEANELCDRVCIISSGKIVGLGTPDQLKRETVSDLHRLTVRFREPVVLDGLELPLPVELHGSDVIFEGHPEQLWETAGVLRRSFGDAIVEIAYTQPTLDDVFMKLTQPSKETR